MCVLVLLGGKSEAALYGLLAGHLPSVLPVCVSWRDQCWAHCRAWLDREVDDTLSKRQESLALPKLPILTVRNAHSIFADTHTHTHSIHTRTLSRAAQGGPTPEL